MSQQPVTRQRRGKRGGSARTDHEAQFPCYYTGICKAIFTLHWKETSNNINGTKSRSFVLKTQKFLRMIVASKIPGSIWIKITGFLVISGLLRRGGAARTDHGRCLHSVQ